jgi:hypothetical protein
VHGLATPHVDAMLAFASTGTRVVFSSGVADDAGEDAAPDLWEIDALGRDGSPRLVWRNPERAHSIVVIGGSFGSLAWVEMPVDGTRAWNLWFWPETVEAPMLLDSHPGDPDVPGFVPSFSVQEDRIVWTAFEAGPNGPRSLLLAAAGPAWEPRLQLERAAAEAELWFPDLAGSRVAFTEVRYAADRLSDERHVHLMDLDDPASMRRLDGSGRATMPVFAGEAVMWKEADPGFSMLNWGRLFRYDLASGEVRPVSTRPVEYVNYPSAGNRYLAWWAADSFTFAVYDHARGHPTLVERHAEATHRNVLRPHVEGDLMVWLFTDELRPDGGSRELRWAWLPSAREPDG